MHALLLAADLCFKIRFFKNLISDSTLCWVYLMSKLFTKEKNQTFSTFFQEYHQSVKLGRVAQSVTCLATDACLTADPGVASATPVRSHTFVEIDNEIISTVILLPSADSFKKGCCQLQAKVCAQITG